MSPHDPRTQALIDSCGGADATIEQMLDLFGELYQRAGALTDPDVALLDALSDPVQAIFDRLEKEAG